jgi:N1221-like protein
MTLSRWNLQGQRLVSCLASCITILVLTKLVKLLPSLVDYFVTITARLRWDEANELPQTRVSLTQ